MFRKKNILYLTHAFTNFQKDQIEILAGHFNKVYVLVRHKPIAELANYLPISSAYNHTFKSRFNFSELPANVIVIPVPLWYVPLDYCYKRLGDYHLKVVLKIIARNKIHFDLIHSHFIWTAGYVGVRLKEHFQKPCIITGHGGDVYKFPFKSKYWFKQISGFLSKTDRLITVSRKNVEYLNRLASKKPVSVIPNGFKSNSFYPDDKIECRRKLQLPAERSILLNISHQVPVKGLHYLVDSVSQLVKTNRNVLCILVGHGEESKKLKAKVKKHGLTNYFLFTGRVEHNQLNDWLNASDIFVLPSLSEGNPTVMFEALACGKPFIGTNVGGIPEIITDNRLGLLCKPGSSEALTDIISKALNTDWNAKYIINYAEQFKWEKICDKVLVLYKELIDSTQENTDQ